MVQARRFDRPMTACRCATASRLALVADTSLSGLRVARELDGIMRQRGKPAGIVSDNGTELASNAILSWADQAQVGWHYIAPGKPQLNGFRAKQSSGLSRVAESSFVDFTAHQSGHAPATQFAERHA